MARPLRVQYEGAVYHVFSRGNAKQQILLDDQDHRSFLRLLSRTAERVEWGIWAYCLMPNHYHLLLQTHRPTLSRGMHDLNAAYSVRFNRRHRRVGHVFQGRFRSIVVDRQAYLVELTRYLVLNPVRAGLTGHPGDWPWSSYRATTGRARPLKGLYTRSILRHFAVDDEAARRQFEAFVMRGIGLPAPAPSRVPTIMGDETSIQAVLGRVEHPPTEVPRAERARLALDDYAKGRTTHDAIRAAYASGTYSQRAIASYFSLHYTTVSRIIGNQSFRNAKSKDLTPTQHLTP
jgi:REP element-mobilizing transposase RayT